MAVSMFKMCIRDRDQTKHEVTFAYADDSTPVVEVTFNLTNEKPEVPEMCIRDSYRTGNQR